MWRIHLGRFIPGFTLQVISCDPWLMLAFAHLISFGFELRKQDDITNGFLAQ